MTRGRGMIIFDLDGTLTVPVLDFDVIRAEIGIESGPILEAVADMPDDQRRRAEAILFAHEERAATTATLQPMAAQCVAQLRESGWPVAILTRNAQRWAAVILDRFAITVDALRTRDDGVIKPSPDSLNDLLAQFDCKAAGSWMIGDHWFDVQTGLAAGCGTILMIGDSPPPTYAARADHVIRSLGEIPAIVGQP